MIASFFCSGSDSNPVGTLYLNDALSRPRPGGAQAPVVREWLDRAAAPYAAPTGGRHTPAPLPSGERSITINKRQLNGQFKSYAADGGILCGFSTVCSELGNAQDFDTSPDFIIRCFFGRDCNIEFASKYGCYLALPVNVSGVDHEGATQDLVLTIDCAYEARGGGNVAYLVFLIVRKVTHSIDNALQAFLDKFLERQDVVRGFAGHTIGLPSVLGGAA